MNKTTLVMGASLKEDRYSNKAVKLLRAYGHKVIAFGNDKGKIDDVEILNSFPTNAEVHTVTLYLNPEVQKLYVDEILKLNPKRIIFNPGTESTFFEQKTLENGIETLEACTLVMLRTDQF